MRKALTKKDQPKASLEMCMHMITLQELHKLTCKSLTKKKDWAQVSPKMHAHMIVLQELQINSQAQALLGKKNQAKVYPKMHTHKK
jgi:hypothetical protein